MRAILGPSADIAAPTTCCQGVRVRLARPGHRRRFAVDVENA